MGHVFLIGIKIEVRIRGDLSEYSEGKLIILLERLHASRGERLPRDPLSPWQWDESAELTVLGWGEELLLGLRPVEDKEAF